MAPHLCIVFGKRCSMPRDTHVAGILVGMFLALAGGQASAVPPAKTGIGKAQIKLVKSTPRLIDEGSCGYAEESRMVSGEDRPEGQ
jgi:hypothetical protein